MKSRGQTKPDRLRKAAIVKMKYLMLTGKMDDGFRAVYEGVLEDLRLKEADVDKYIDKHRAQLEKVCLGNG